MEKTIIVKGYSPMAQKEDFDERPQEYVRDCCDALIDVIPKTLEMGCCLDEEGSHVPQVTLSQVKITVTTTIKVEPYN